MADIEDDQFLAVDAKCLGMRERPDSEHAKI